MKKKTPELIKALGPKLAMKFGGGSAGSSTQLIDSLPPSQRSVVRVAFADSLMPMWIMYTAFAGAGLLTAFLIKRKVLTSEHHETKTGMEAEKENAAQRQAEREAKRESKRQSQMLNPSRGGSRPASGLFSHGSSRPVSQNASKVHIEPVQEGEKTPHSPTSPQNVSRAHIEPVQEGDESGDVEQGKTEAEAEKSKE